jgi:hypothetical protein
MPEDHIVGTLDAAPGGVQARPEPDIRPRSQRSARPMSGGLA